MNFVNSPFTRENGENRENMVKAVKTVKTVLTRVKGMSYAVTTPRFFFTHVKTMHHVDGTSYMYSIKKANS